jgi:hypothetical protein
MCIATKDWKKKPNRYFVVHAVLEVPQSKSMTIDADIAELLL